jgi:hypothetical protein
MKFIRLAAAMLASGCAVAPAWSAVDVGVGITIREPGVYGRIELGNRPPPPVLYPQPVVIAAPAVVVAEPPLYLYVPPGHAKHWDKHCHRYNACGRQVYFVQERWVKDEYSRARADKGPPEHSHGREHDQRDRRDRHDRHED